MYLSVSRTERFSQVHKNEGKEPKAERVASEAVGRGASQRELHDGAGCRAFSMNWVSTRENVKVQSDSQINLRRAQLRSG